MASPGQGEALSRLPCSGWSAPTRCGGSPGPCHPGTFDAGRSFGLIGALPLDVLPAERPTHAAALRLGAELDHPVYDCLYLALALERGAALATADRRFLDAVRRAGALPPERLLTPPSA